MSYEDFVGQVQHRAQLASTGDAVSAIRATLETLAERLTFEEARDLASQLPKEIGIHLAIMPELHAQRFSLDDFYQLVASREPADRLDAIQHARAVLEVLGEAVSRGEIQDICSQLPLEFRELIEAGKVKHD
jgi:uncharacterized protein (DUF2267 family)